MYNFDDPPDLLDPNDPETAEVLDELQAEGMFDNYGPKINSNMTNQEAAIVFFLWYHNQEEIFEAQREGLEYFWAGGKLQ